MPSDDLNKPLRRQVRPPAAKRGPFLPAALAGGLLLASAVAVWVAVVDDPDGGYPVAVASISDAPITTGSLAETEASPASRIGLELSPRFPETIGAQPATSPAGGPDPGLTEMSAFGPLPRLSPDGRRPRDAYARRAPAVPPGTPRIAIVVGGLGLSQTGTQKAIEALPEDVTLAFAPLGSSLQRWVEKARAKVTKLFCRFRWSL
jgi:hypothetical protein